MRSTPVVIALCLPLVGLNMFGCAGDDAPTGVDREPPAVISLIPADGAMAVALDATIQVIFSEPVVIDSLGAPPLRVDGPDGPLAAALGLDSTATTLTLSPALPFPIGLEYRVVLAAGIADQSGNARPDSLMARFTTGLAFQDIGRLFVVNEMSRDVSVFDVTTYAAVDGSPVSLPGAPRRLHTDPVAGVVYILYFDYRAGGGVLALDARSLEILRDSGPVLPGDVST